MAKTGEQHYQDYQNYIAEGRVQSAGLSLLTACLCGYCPAQAELGYKYLHGILFPKDYEQAMRWLTAASEQGDAASMTNLATMYMYGRGAQTNGKKAAEETTEQAAAEAEEAAAEAAVEQEEVADNPTAD